MVPKAVLAIKKELHLSSPCYFFHVSVRRSVAMLIRQNVATSVSRCRRRRQVGCTVKSRYVGTSTCLYVGKLLNRHVGTSVCRYVGVSICQHVNMSGPGMPVSGYVGMSVTRYVGMPACR